MREYQVSQSITGERRLPEAEIAQDGAAYPKGAKRSDTGTQANTYDEGSRTRLELERSNGVFELMLDQFGSLMDTSAKTEQP